MKKNSKKLLTVVSATLAAAFAVSGAACAFPTQGGQETSVYDDNAIQLLKSDYEMTQEDKLSRIKADYLKKNGGYRADDEVVAFITLDGDALIEEFMQGGGDYESVSDYARSYAGANYSAKLKAVQSVFTQNLIADGLIDSVVYHYTTIMNAVAVKTVYGNLSVLGALAGVEGVNLSETYNRPQSVSDDASVIVNDVDVYDTGIYNSGAVEYTGKRTSVAVLDSGFDCSHTVFSHDIDDEDQAITASKVREFLNKESNCKSTSADLKFYNVYYSTKIPFHYDYADKDPDVFPYDSEHGTHVAGIIGGKDDVITGVAVDTQLVCMKVFPDLETGGRTEDILAAIEDAVLLGVDAINMSLGSSCGFSRMSDEEHLNAVYDSVKNAGISLITAASNDYSAAYGGANGNTNKVTNPDSGTVGSPSTYDAALSVASISGVKSSYIIANDEKAFFFKESSATSGKENDFIAELIAAGVLPEGEEKTFEYVTIPGTGSKVSYNNVNVEGKIALVRRGDNTFEEKALLAKRAGAIACIIYNNVEGDILMSMGKTDHIPTVSISKEIGTELASRANGTMTLSSNFKAGPFMSDFSSWGPTPSLGIKPEITAHGGKIKSAVPNNGYDELSGTSMATPNLCGVVLLVRQYVKDNFPEIAQDPKEVTKMTNQLLMSTAGIILNEEGNPYSPRKQGAGLASLKNLVNSNAYLTVDGNDRTKLELKDDPERTGVYTMEFNVVNISENTLTYDISVAGMTESVSFSDSDYVAETAHMLGGTQAVTVTGGGSISGNTLTVNASATVKVKLVYKLTAADREYIEGHFRYGMYVEGFVKLTSESEVNLNIPFLAFYGDWTEAPLFDKTYYEVESEAHDGSIDEEDKLKADYYATTPYGSYYYNYMIPLGTFLYKFDESKYDAIPASLDKIAISDTLGTIDGISTVYTGLLRNAKSMVYTITDKLTGEEIWSFTDYDCAKAHYYNGIRYPYLENLKLSSSKLNLINNRRYEFKMTASLDYGDGGVSTNIRNTFNFDFCFDNEAPVIRNASYEKVYDKTLKKDRYYLTMTVSDNHYAMSIAPIIFTSSSSYAYLTDNPIPLYGTENGDTTVRIEITDYLDAIYADTVVSNSLAFVVDDYALNSNIYLCQLPGTKGAFSFTYTGEADGTKMDTISVYKDEILDLTKYLATSDSTVDEGKDYLKYMSWTSSDETVAVVRDGLVRGLKAGLVKITATEKVDGKRASVIVRVKEQGTTDSEGVIANHDSATLESVDFIYYDTLFAYSRAAQTSEIGKTGSRMFLTDVSSVSFYPGEKIQLSYKITPWYVEDKYEFTYTSGNPLIAKVEEDGTVTALKEGSAYITLTAKGSNIMARVRVTVKSPFIIDGRVLTAYKGLGGEVVIPDDEGIIYIGSYAFCLYTTDESVELTEDDYDANKIPSKNTSITKIVIPEGVEDIQKYAFYHCENLREVVLPTSVKYIRDFCFYGDSELKTVSLPEDNRLEVIGRMAFGDCKALESFDLSEVYALGEGAFYNTSLQSANLSALRNTANGRVYSTTTAGEYMYTGAFANCEKLTSVIMNKDTKLAEYMFMGAGLQEADIYCTDCEIPAYCFSRCKSLTRVTVHGDVEGVGIGAFRECESLSSVTFSGDAKWFAEQAFMNDKQLEEFILPSCELKLGNSAFVGCEKLTRIVLGKKTKFVELDGSIFENTAIEEIDATQNEYYSSQDFMLLDKGGTTLIFAFIGHSYGDLTVPETVTNIGASSFCGADISSVTITNKNTQIGAYAFADCTALTRVTLPVDAGVTVGAHAFHGSGVEEVENLASVLSVGERAFMGSKLTSASIGANATVGEGAFYHCTELSEVTVGEGAKLGAAAFRLCTKLTTVNMPDNGGVEIDGYAFAQCTALTNIDLSKTTNTLGAFSFYGCTALTAASLENVEYIGEYAFSDCSQLAALRIPAVIEIGDGAFSRNTQSGSAPQFASYASLFPSTLKKIGKGAFLGAGGITEIVLPESLEELGDYAFAYCGSITSVTLPSSVKRIGTYAFAGCAQIQEISLDDVTQIGERAFYNCEALEKVSLSNVETIEKEAFKGAMISSKITANALKEVGDSAFSGNYIPQFEAQSLQSIGYAAFEGNRFSFFVLSNELSFVGDRAFKDCSMLYSFTYSVNGQNSTSGVINDYAFLDDGILYTYTLSGRYELRSVPAAKNITTLTVKEGAFRVAQYAANGNSTITKVILPDSMRTIGSYAFFGCNRLKTVEFRSVTAPTLENAYESKLALDEGEYGYDIIHKYFDFFGLELCYTNFVALVGRNEPIQMILPKNSDIKGYDFLVYEVYFGKVKDAERSDYVARQQALIDFYEYAGKLDGVTTLTLEHEELVNNAISAYNAVTQNPADYGYDAAEYARLTEMTLSAKRTLTLKKISAYGTEALYALQESIFDLDPVFSIANIAKYRELASRIASLKADERQLMYLAPYNALVQSYNVYLGEIETEVAPVKNAVSGMGMAAEAVAAMTAFAALAYATKRYTL